MMVLKTYRPIQIAKDMMCTYFKNFSVLLLFKFIQRQKVCNLPIDKNRQLWGKKSMLANTMSVENMSSLESKCTIDIDFDAWRNRKHANEMP